MKYLILLMVLTGCIQQEPENTSKPVIISNSSGGSIEDAQKLRSQIRECIMITELGYIKDQSTFDQCRDHLTKPKYKIGQKFQFKDPAVMGKCVFVIKRLIWSHGYVMNKPAYEGDQTCTNKGELVLFIGDQYKQETELTERTSK